jgi:type II secretory pathway pseudopilin PulG
VVIAIIGILASIVLVSTAGSKAKSRDAKRVSDIRTIQLALETYYNDNQSYPTSITTSPFIPTYMTTLPTDPTNSGVYTYKYSSYKSGGGISCGGSTIVRYHLAAVMESCDSSAGASCPTYNGDSDWTSPGWSSCTGSTADFNGNATNCSGTTGALNDNCYDVTN